MTKLCVKDGVTKLCVKVRVCDKAVCERECMTKLCVKVRVCDNVECDKGGGGAGRRRRVREERDTESKTRTPHKDVGKKDAELLLLWLVPAFVSLSSVPWHGRFDLIP